MGQKCEGNCGLWVFNKILKKTYPEILKKIVGAVWEITSECPYELILSPIRPTKKCKALCYTNWGLFNIIGLIKFLI